MAEKKSSKRPIVRDNTLFFSDLNFMPSADKNELWCAQQIFYLHQNGTRFIDPLRYKKYNQLDLLIIDPKELINMVDPPTPMGGGGKATYFAADWKTIPIDVHLDNIVRAKLDKIGFENKLQVSEIDKFAKTQRQKDKDKILFQSIIREIINSCRQQYGKPPISESEDVYKWMANQKVDEAKQGEREKTNSDTIDNFADYIRTQIKNSESLALYESYIYKGDVERAFELGIEHYLINLNKWRIKADYFNNDIKNFNRCAGLWYVDETTGRGNVRNIKLTNLWTLPFVDKVGEDLTGWRIEEEITFAEFVRRFGQTLTDEQLKEVFEINKANGTHNMNWSSAKGAKGSNAMIRIGQMGVLTQDADKFAEEYVNNRIPTWKRKAPSWMPAEKDSGKIRNRIYNVWYGCYYVPPPGDKLNSNTMADWTWQSQYVFDLKKDIDMYRYGVDERYAKSSLVVWKDERASFTDVKEAFMPKIRFSWQKFQNCLINDIDAVGLSEDFIGAALAAVDESNKNNEYDPSKPTGGNGYDAKLESMKMIREGNMAFLKMTDKQGNAMVDPSKFVIPIKNGQLDRAEKYLKIILDQYNLMMISLAQNDVTEGQQAKPRTNEESIRASMISSSQGSWYMEKGAREFLIMYGERCVQFILNVVKERKKFGFKQRWEEFNNVIGMANALMIEGIEYLKPEEIGITVSLEDVTANQDYVIGLANKMADDGEVGREVVGLVMNQAKVNWKYAYVLLMVASKKKEEEKAAQEELAHQRAMQLKGEDLKIAQSMQDQKIKGNLAAIDEKGKIEKMLLELGTQFKTLSQSVIKEQVKNNRVEQDKNKTALNQEAEAKEELLQP